MKKILYGLWWLVKSIIIAVLVIMAILYYFDSTAPTSTAVVLRDTTIYNDPSGTFESKNMVMKYNTVELINDSDTTGFSRIKYDTTQIGFVPTRNLLTITPVYPDENVSTRVLRVDSKKLSSLGRDSATQKVIRSLAEHSKNADFIAVYLEISDDYSWADLAYILEKVKIPYGYFVPYEKHEQYMDSATIEEYNILPTVINISGKYVSEYEMSDIKKHIGEDTCFYDSNPISNIQLDSNFWTVNKESFKSRNHMMMDSKDEVDSSDPLIFATINRESFMFGDFIEQYDRLD